MKKILLGLCALSVLYASSCKKSDDNNTSSGGGLVIGGTSYSTTTAGSTFLVQGPQIAVAGVNNGLGASLSFTFGTTNTPAAGTYKIVDYNASPSATEVVVLGSKITSGQSQSYASTTSTGNSVTVSVSNGKYTVKMPEVTLTGIVGTSGTTTASCDATQQ
jgi:hypothetical protein